MKKTVRFIRVGSIFGISALCLMATVLLTAPARAESTAETDAVEHVQPVSGPGSEPVIARLRNTYYYLVREADYAKYPENDVLLDMQDRQLARVSSRFRKALDIEGSGHLMNGKVVNYAGVKNGRVRYRYTRNPWGDGVGTCALVPFHSIAVDPKVVPLGSLVRIDETVNMVLPDGTLHDGLWRAVDVGGAIRGDRVDLYVGDGDQGRILSKAKIRHLQPLTVRLVEEPEPNNCTRISIESVTE